MVLLNKEDEESYKIISSLIVHNLGWGYTCFASAYAIFVSDKEVKT
jgi:hypothetical protein